MIMLFHYGKALGKVLPEFGIDESGQCWPVMIILHRRA